MQKLIQFLLLFVIAACAGAGVFYLLNGPKAQVVEDQLEGRRSLPKTRQEFHDRLAEFRMSRQKVKNTIEALGSEKSKTLAHLKSKGINSSADIKDGDSDVQFALNALKRLVEDIEARKEDVKVYDEAIVGLETQLDDLKRKYINAQGTITEEEYFDLQKHIIDLNERLKGEEPDIFEQEKILNILDQEMEAEGK